MSEETSQHESRRTGKVRGRKPKTAAMESCGTCGAACDSAHLYCPACGRRRADLQEPPVETPVKQREEPLEVTPSWPEPELPRPEKMDDPSPAIPAPQQFRDAEPLSESRCCASCGAKVKPAMPQYRLVRRTAEGATEVIGLIKDEMILGKDPACDVVVPTDNYLSRKHARLSNSNGTLLIEDLKSSNGTFVKVRQAIMLEVGDEIVAGTSVFRIEAV